ncbi:MAG: HdeD family acid-resistance protein [Chlamydiales bacterium]|nr:HdeD family acid-resistance protein [Chlamydiia bacterium]MCP5507393.1 HdeD family acid-resistance protein [Chlamydiales bacterium]
MEAIKNNWKMLMFEGVVLVILGILAVAMPVYFTISFELLLGCLLVISGLVQGYRAFSIQGAPTFLLSMLGALITLVVGGLMLFYPLTGVLTLTVLLAILFFVDGVFKIIQGFQMKESRNWGWLVFSGILGILIAAIVWSGWPYSAIWFIGLMVGINLIFMGWAAIILAMELKN